MKTMRYFIHSLAIITMIITQSCNNQNTVAQTSGNLADSNTKNSEKIETAKPVHLTKSDFLVKVMNYEKNPEEWIFEGDKPCIIDFYATWCGPCKMMAPILDEIAADYAGKINVYKIDTDKERELAAVFGIQSIPSFLYCPMKGKPFMTQGAAGKDMVKEIIDKRLLNTVAVEN